MILWPCCAVTYVTWGISFDEIPVSLDCCITGLWHELCPEEKKKSLNIAQSKMLGVRWLEHRWLIYHGYFERVHEFLDFFP